MKQILLTIIIFIFIACFPISAFATTVELSVDITSFKVPERSAVIQDPANSYITNLNGSQNIEFETCSNVRIFLTDKSNSYIATSHLYTDYLGEQSGVYCLVKGARSVLSFNYNALLAPYKVYAEIDVNKQQNEETGFKPDCTSKTLTTGGIAWYSLKNSLDFYKGNGNYAVAKCPSYYCINGNPDNCGDVNSMIFSATHVIGYNDKNQIICSNDTATNCSDSGVDTGVTQYFWRSPVLHTYQFQL